jgi:hypothetical protein
MFFIFFWREWAYRIFRAEITLRIGPIRTITYRTQFPKSPLVWDPLG